MRATKMINRNDKGLGSLKENIRMKRNILLIIALLAVSAFWSCSKSKELAPKTGELNSEFLLPKAPMLTNEDREAINKRLEEYNDAVGL